jgi:hypothetical protein
VRRAMAAAMAFARRPGERDPTLWEVRSRAMRIRGPGPPGASAAQPPPPMALGIRVAELAGLGPAQELGLLAGVLPTVLVLLAGVDELDAAKRVARLAHILEPSCTVAVVGPAAGALDAEPGGASVIDLWWSGDDGEER